MNESDHSNQMPLLVPGSSGEDAGRSAEPAGTAVPRLGLTTDHRRLFGALASGWLQPLRGNSALLLCVGGFASESEAPPAGHRIAVRLRLNTSKLPNLDVPVRRDGQWAPRRLHDLCTPDSAVQWPGAIPAFAISSVEVFSAEEKDRLVGLSRQAQDLDLSDVEIKVANDAISDPYVAATNDTVAKLAIPPEHDAILGALTMAVWAVPRIDPWMDVLQAAIAGDPAGLESKAAHVDALWWCFPPWQQQIEHPQTLGESLWLAAADAFRSDCTESQPASPQQLLDQIAMQATAHGDEDFHDGISAWLEGTARILRADTTIQLEGWRQNPVGLAIQLVLTRPDPARFKTWFKDKPSLPPGVAWSAATLCGLLKGYKRLGSDVRGCALQRELLSIEALAACSPQLAGLRWPTGRLDLQWRRQGASFLLAHKGQDIACKAQHARGKWHAADFANVAVANAAKDLAAELKWPCVKVSIEDMAVPTSGTGKLDVRDGHLDVNGHMDLFLPMQGTWDVEHFRRLVAVECGELPTPPEAAPDAIAIPPDVDIPGFRYERNFLDEEQERHLVQWIDKQAWSNELKRRVQHYGWRYDYKGRKVDPSMRIGELPEPLAKIAQRLVDEELVGHLPDQVIINEYSAEQGIRRHADAPRSFHDGIATVSLVESWEMLFYAGSAKDALKVSRLLERRSVAVMSGDARWKWQHAIAGRKTDIYADGTGERRRHWRKRRVSLTFRKVRSQN